MLTLRNVTKSDQTIYTVWENDLKLKGYLSRLCPSNCSVDNYDESRICWFIIQEDACDIGSVCLEKDTEYPDIMVLGIFIFDEQHRGKGFGRDVIKEAIRISKQRIAFSKVRLNVRKSNIRAIECYKKCGFDIYGEGQKSTSNGSIINYYQMEMKVED